MIRRLILDVPDRFKTQELCNVAVHMEPDLLVYVRDHFKTQEMYKEAVRREPYTLRFIPDHLKTLGMRNEVMRVRPAAFFLIHFFLLLTILKLKRCALRGSRYAHGSCTMFLITLRPKGRAIGQ